MKTLEKVSIIVPVYNVEKYLPECLDSIINQTLKEIEIICINDGSPDNSLEILKSYSQKDSRIKIIDKKNEGVGKARNDGIRAATGEFIAFMDSDDYYPSDNVLEILYNDAVNNDVKIAGGRKQYLLPEGNTEIETYPFYHYGLTFEANGIMKYADFQYDYGYTQYIYERRMLVDNGIEFPPYKRFQDPPFFVKAMICAGEFYADDCLSYCYRRIRTASKYSISNTVNMLCGLTDNLIDSRKSSLPKLHFLTAQRINRDASFMAIQNIFDSNSHQLLSKFIKATSMVDVEWLKENGYDIKEPFVPEVFDYLISTAEKYEKIRNNGFAKKISKIIKR